MPCRRRRWRPRTGSARCPARTKEEPPFAPRRRPPRTDPSKAWWGIEIPSSADLDYPRARAYTSTGPEAPSRDVAGGEQAFRALNSACRSIRLAACLPGLLFLTCRPAGPPRCVTRRRSGQELDAGDRHVDGAAHRRVAGATVAVAGIAVSGGDVRAGELPLQADHLPRRARRAVRRPAAEIAERRRHRHGIRRRHRHLLLDRVVVTGTDILITSARGVLRGGRLVERLELQLEIAPRRRAGDGELHLGGGGGGRAGGE